MTLHASTPRPSKRPRLSHSSPLDFTAEAFAAEEDLARQRFLSQNRLKSNWERIFAKYSQDFEGIADEIDQATGEIVVDNGHVRGMDDGLNILGVEEWGWEDLDEAGVQGGVKGRGKGKGGGSGSGKRKVQKKDETRLAIKAIGQRDDASISEGCEVCRYKDELDGSICRSCSPLKSAIKITTSASSTATASESHLMIDSVSIQSPKSAALSPIIKKSSSLTSISNYRDVTMDGMDGASDIPPPPHAENMPSDAFIIEKLGSHGAAVVGLLAKARANELNSSSAGKSELLFLRRDRVEVEVSPRQPAKESPKQLLGQSDIRNWTPLKVITWMLTHEILSDEEDADIARALKEHKISGAIVANGLTIDDLKDKLKIQSFGRRMQLWSGILRLRALVPLSNYNSAKASLSNTSTAATQDQDPWALPPQQVDPFYSHMWGDEHPDGTPAKFPPRIVDPMFLTPGPAAISTPKASSEKKRKGKRKRESLTGGVLGTPEVVEGVKTPTIMAPVLRDKAPTAKTPAVREKASAPGTPITKTPVMKTPAMKTPALRNKAFATGTPPTNTAIVQTPAVGRSTTRTTAVKTSGKTPVEKALTLKTPVVRDNASAAGTPTTVPAVEAPAAKTPVVRKKASTAGTPTQKTPVAKTPAVKALMKTPKTKSEALVKSTPARTPRTRTTHTETPIVWTPTVKTPARKTPAAKATAKSIIPGWTTGSIGRTAKRAAWNSLLALEDTEDFDDELSVDHTKSSPAPRKTATPIKINVPKEEVDEDDGNFGVGGLMAEEKVESVMPIEEKELKEEDKTEHKTEHKCNGGFCFVCLDLDGEEDDLI